MCRIGEMTFNLATTNLTVFLFNETKKIKPNAESACLILNTHCFRAGVLNPSTSTTDYLDQVGSMNHSLEDTNSLCLPPL